MENVDIIHPMSQSSSMFQQRQRLEGIFLNKLFNVGLLCPFHLNVIIMLGLNFAHIKGETHFTFGRISWKRSGYLSFDIIDAYVKMHELTELSTGNTLGKYQSHPPPPSPTPIVAFLKCLGFLPINYVLLFLFFSIFTIGKWNKRWSDFISFSLSEFWFWC